jgi:heme-degrading monooxygenase HmoA
MIFVHETFICKPGNASKLARKFKEAMAGFSEHVYVLTDVTGSFNKVVIVSQYDNLTAYEKNWEAYSQKSEEMKKVEQAMSGYQEMYLTGSRDIYQVT